MNEIHVTSVIKGSCLFAKHWNAIWQFSWRQQALKNNNRLLQKSKSHGQEGEECRFPPCVCTSGCCSQKPAVAAALPARSPVTRGQAVQASTLFSPALASADLGTKKKKKENKKRSFFLFSLTRWRFSEYVIKSHQRVLYHWAARSSPPPAEDTKH